MFYLLGKYPKNHFKEKTSKCGILLTIADKEAEMTVMLFLYEVCRKNYEVPGPYIHLLTPRLE